MKRNQYENRYGENWTIVSQKTRRKTGHRCCFPGCEDRATETHHSIYQDKDGAIKGREIPGVHVFPLCDRHHKVAHQKRNWLKSKTDPELNNRNTPEFYRLLRQGWLAIVRPEL